MLGGLLGEGDKVKGQEHFPHCSHIFLSVFCFALCSWATPVAAQRSLLALVLGDNWFKGYWVDQAQVTCKTNAIHSLSLSLWWHQVFSRGYIKSIGSKSSQILVNSYSLETACSLGAGESPGSKALALHGAAHSLTTSPKWFPKPSYE